MITRLVRAIRRLTRRTPRYAVGGKIVGHRPNDDSIPVMLHSGCTYSLNVNPSVDIEDVLRHLNTHLNTHLPRRAPYC